MLLWQKLPIPLVVYKTTEHAWCSPLEVISLALLSPLNKHALDHKNDRFQTLLQSMSYLEKRNLIPEQYRNSALNTNNSPILFVYFLLWSDGWDPNRSNKGYRTPVWTATGTFLFVELGITDKLFQVSMELLSAGLGKEEHTHFFEMLREEKLEKWQEPSGALQCKWIYSRKHNTTVRTFISMNFFLQDNPERRGVTELLAGNSNNHGIFGVSCEFDKLAIPFPACPKCCKRILLYLLTGDFHLDLTDWECQQCHVVGHLISYVHWENMLFLWPQRLHYSPMIMDTI